MRIAIISAQDAEKLARLHISTITTGFIGSLGLDFMTTLYQAIAKSDAGFGFVAREGDEVLGFVAFTSDINALYKSVLKANFFKFAILLAGKMFSLHRIKRVLQTMFYPGKVEKLNLPKAELLSIAVSANARGKGIAQQLVTAGFAECARRGIGEVKVLVAAHNEAANKLYIKCGFTFARQIDSHGVTSNIYIAKTNIL